MTYGAPNDNLNAINGTTQDTYLQVKIYRTLKDMYVWCEKTVYSASCLYVQVAVHLDVFIHHIFSYSHNTVILNLNIKEVFTKVTLNSDHKVTTHNLLTTKWLTRRTCWPPTCRRRGGSLLITGSWLGNFQRGRQGAWFGRGEGGRTFLHGGQKFLKNITATNSRVRIKVRMRCKPSQKFEARRWITNTRMKNWRHKKLSPAHIESNFQHNYLFWLAVIPHIIFCIV